MTLAPQRIRCLDATSPSPPTSDTASLIFQVKSVLLELNASPYPAVACPPEVPKRASVALILRIQPNYSHWPPSQNENPYFESSEADPSSFAESISGFFDQDWVRHGDPELLFIKRAARVGDKWTGHVALPGGKRDPEDADDEAAAVREAWEEVGIDLSEGNAIRVGNLPQRIVTSSWGKVALMTLCPYIFLLRSPLYPAQRLQPTEVASTHWIPLRSLMSPALRTHEKADVSARLARSEFGVGRWFLQAMLSKMMFAAIRLTPSNSTYCASIPSFIPEESPPNTFKNILVGSHAGSDTAQQPLMLWGLTLGVVSDFLEHIPPHNAVELWTYPTFANWDVRFVMWVISSPYRRRKAIELSSTYESAPLDTLPGAVSPPSEEEEEKKPGEVGIAGLGLGRDWGKTGRSAMENRGAAVNKMLEGYYPLVRRAVFIALVGRLSVVAGLGAYVWHRYGARVRGLLQ